MTRTGLRRFRQLPKAGHLPGPRNVGFSAVELVIAVAVVLVAVALAVPWVLGARAAARLNSCRDHLRTLTHALHAYHASHGQFPPAADWDSGVTPERNRWRTASTRRGRSATRRTRLPAPRASRS
jgi:type II secretory pathway pseudopilin PulG